MALPHVLPRLKPIYPQNRKYIGSKYPLLDFIAGVVEQRAPEARSLADLFAGTGVVACHFAARGLRVTAADTLYHNWIALRCFLGEERGAADEERLTELLWQLDELPPEEGYCHRWFGGTYFTAENAGRIDAIRERIARWARSGQITPRDEAVLLTSLIYAADKVANTCGQYDAYLKHLGATPYSAEGTHRVDAMVYRKLQLGLPKAIAAAGASVYCASAEQVVARGQWDLLYLDPPYNNRQYIDNYHVLENIARWEKPAVYGKTAKFPRADLKSPYSTKRAATAALSRLIASARARHILLSYNNEGIVPDDAIIAALEARGPVEVFTREYAIFGGGAGRSGRRPIVERLFCCRVTTEAQV